MIKELKSEFSKKLHAKIRTVSIIHLKELQTEISKWRSNGLISEKFFNQNYGHFSFKPTKTIPDACSIIIIAVPQKITSVEFSYKGIKYKTVLPHYYVHSKIQKICWEILSEVLEKKGYLVERAKLPLKLLAVRSGLAKYGKNNTCYIDGMGSFAFLEAFYTNYRFTDNDWNEKRLLKSCKTCTLCQDVCPNRCITNERFLIHADQCLTYFNEKRGYFPSWIKKKSHNALIGCIRCQIACPQNKKFLKFNRQIINFTEKETSTILQKTPQKLISKTLAKKLKYSDFH